MQGEVLRAFAPQPVALVLIALMRTTKSTGSVTTLFP